MVRNTGWDKVEEKALRGWDGKKINLIGEEVKERGKIKVKAEKK